jgi:hypothetical protein
MRTFDGGRRRRTRTIERTCFINGGLTGFIYMSKQLCSLTLSLGGYGKLAANDCASRRITCDILEGRGSWDDMVVGCFQQSMGKSAS